MNIAVIFLFSIIANLFNIGGYLGPDGTIYVKQLLVFATIFGFLGSFISLLLSKWTTKRMMKVRVIKQPANEMEAFLVQVCSNVASQIGIETPEVGIYDKPEMNAFATGWNKNKALVAVSTGLLQRMNKDEIEGVLGHEMAHIANGDMVTMALLQGVINTFVIIIARIIASVLSRGEDGVNYGVHYAISIVLEIIFGFLAGLILYAFSRWREYGADAGSAQYVGRGKMIAALKALAQNTPPARQLKKSAMAPLQISNAVGGKMRMWLRTHPPIEMRIAALQKG